MTAERIASGRAVINDFKAGTLDGIKTYDRICKALDLIGRWSAETVTNFVEQFADIDDLLDEDCTALVEKLCHIEWRFIPRKSRPQFVQLLRRIGMQHVVHTKSVVDCFVFQFLAPVQPVALIQSQTSQAKADEVSAFELILPDDELEENFHLAHSSLTLFLQCLPVSLILIRKSVMRYYPHFSCPKIRYVLYVRNILLLASFHSVLRNDIWSLIVENLAQFDAHVSQGADNSFNTATDELSKNFAEVFIMVKTFIFISNEDFTYPYLCLSNEMGM
ncbi:hypothetical protein AB6A40_010923 [Gnathostoma spinigerum]|uniref:Uncharacterized protein n=1 Tax=Gnathostoma spinigerum TaxID=75299 RepID=A0ABD6F2H1_9BILA